MKINRVVAACDGVLGSQIAFQIAYCGFDVTIWLRSEGSITRTQPKLDHLREVYIKLELDMKKAVQDADLLIESMAENEEEKIAFYKKLAPLLPEKTIIVTNSSTLLPSKFAKYTDRQEKYLSLHFANSIWKNNMAEIMAQAKTDSSYFEQVVEFAKEIRMIPLSVRKEKSGYLLNCHAGATFIFRYESLCKRNFQS